jgi:predicted ester cyclase
MSNLAEITEFAQRYAEAWCSQNPESVAAFFAENGSLSVNDGPPAVGRAAITEIARGFMRDFPDMIVTMDDVSHGPELGGRSSSASPARTDAVFHWTLTGTNSGPGGTGKRVRISGYELWKIDSDDLIAESKGRFDAAEYERQMRG